MPSCEYLEYLNILKEIDIFAYTHTEEAFRMAVLEACSFNKKIIAYKAGGIIDILENYKKEF